MTILDLIKEHEGLRLHPYQCPADKTTIGYGRNLDDKGITEAEAEYLLANDVSEVSIELHRQLPFMYELDDARRAVLIDMAFNMGVAGLLKFQKTLAHVEQGDYQKAAIEMFDSRWASQVGRRANRLADMMQSGQWPDKG